MWSHNFKDQSTIRCFRDSNECNICLVLIYYAFVMFYVSFITVYYGCFFAEQLNQTAIISHSLSCHDNKASILNHKSVRTCPRSVHHCCARPFLPTTTLTNQHRWIISVTPNIIFKSEVDTARSSGFRFFSRILSFNS